MACQAARLVNLRPFDVFFLFDACFFRVFLHSQHFSPVVADDPPNLVVPPAPYLGLPVFNLAP